MKPLENTEGSSVSAGLVLSSAGRVDWGVLMNSEGLQPGKGGCHKEHTAMTLSVRRKSPGYMHCRGLVSNAWCFSSSRMGFSVEGSDRLNEYLRWLFLGMLPNMSQNCFVWLMVKQDGTKSSHSSPEFSRELDQASHSQRKAINGIKLSF